MSNWGKSKWRSTDEELATMNRKLEICVAALEDIAEETGTPYANTAQKALDEVKKWT